MSKKLFSFFWCFFAVTVPLFASERLGPVRFTDIPYVKDGGIRQSLDIVLPHDYEKSEKLPVIVYIHGGGWTKGDKSGYSKNPALLEQGFACVSINYRYLNQAFFPAQVEDCKAAVRWLRAHAKTYHLDPEHIGVFGTSAGGHLAAMLGVTGDVRKFDVGDYLEYDSRVQAVCNAFGPSDMIPYLDHPKLFASTDKSMAEIVEKNRDQIREKIEAVSPILYLKPGKTYPPFLLLHGDRDLLVPISSSIQFEQKLKTLHGDIELSIAEGVGHGGGVLSFKGHFGKMVTFFKKHLNGTR